MAEEKSIVADNKPKSTMIHDAVILCVITLLLGAVLAGVYALTKGTIDQAQAKANTEACGDVAKGDTVQDNSADMVASVTSYLEKHDLSNAEKADGETLAAWVEVDQVHPTANGGKVFLASAKKGYGGAVDFALGVDAEGKLTGIKITKQSETAGLGANCTNEEWQKSFVGKSLPSNAADNMYNKLEENDNQVQALSGATVTSRAVTNAVKGLLFAAASLGEGGGQ